MFVDRAKYFANCLASQRSVHNMFAIKPIKIEENISEVEKVTVTVKAFLI